MNQKTGRIEPIESLSEIHRFLPELQREVSLEFFSLDNLGSSEVTLDHWVEIAETIKQNYSQYEGFVVIHGTNTMSYTAAALSFALQGLSKPVVLTGAVLPINDIAGDGRMNLVYAIRTAQLDIAEVCVVLGQRVLRGSRVKKVDQSLLQTFDSPSCNPLAEYNASVYLGQHRTVRRKRTLDYKAAFDPNVMMVTLHPAITDIQLESVLHAKPRGIVFRTYGPGMIPERIFDWLKTVTHQDIPVLITSQALRGKVDLSRYRKQVALERMGIMSGGNMTYECSLVKFMWALANSNSPRKLKDLMEKSLVGEKDV